MEEKMETKFGTMHFIKGIPVQKYETPLTQEAIDAYLLRCKSQNRNVEIEIEKLRFLATYGYITGKFTLPQTV